MLILASSSPRRRELLTQAGFPFRVVSLPVEEGRHPGEDPILYTQRLARAKAEVVYLAEMHQTEKHSAENHDPKNHGLEKHGAEKQKAERFIPLYKPAPKPIAAAVAPAPPKAVEPLLVLGADTVVVCDDHVLGKPADPQDAARMLKMLSGRTHRVITGVCLISAVGVDVASETTQVTMQTLSHYEIHEYIATGEPVDKAGAYAVQGRAGRWIPRIDGCYFNVVGLPLSLVGNLIEGMKAKLAAGPVLVTTPVTTSATSSATTAR